MTDQTPEEIRLHAVPEVPVLDPGGQPLRKVSERIARVAHAEYAAQGHRQTFERLHERGGFSAAELIELLAQRIERLEATRG